MLEVVQGSKEWHDARRGKVTASRIADIMAKTKTGYSASRANYMAELLCERLTGVTRETFTNTAMAWGTDQEPEARKMYEFMKDVDVKQVGFVDHPTIAQSGASPDGLVGEDGLIEIKCPNTATHIETLLGADIDAKYLKQMHWQMVCTSRQWCDFVSFDPRLPEAMQIHIRRVDYDPQTALEIEDEVLRFLYELREKETALTHKFGPHERTKIEHPLMAGE